MKKFSLPVDLALFRTFASPCLIGEQVQLIQNFACWLLSLIPLLRNWEGDLLFRSSGSKNKIVKVLHICMAINNFCNTDVFIYSWISLVQGDILILL